MTNALHILISHAFGLRTEKKGSAAVEMHLPTKSKKTSPYVSAFCGATAGVVSRFVIAPLDVVKIRLQIQTNRAGDPARKYTGMIQCLRTIVREEGLTGLWKGNLSAEYLYLTYGALQFLSYSEAQALIHRVNVTEGGRYIPESSESYLSGAAAGFIATAGTYPFDLLRTRFAAQTTDRVYSGVWQAMKHIYSRDGLRGFYRGLSPALIQLVPYTALMFGTYSMTKRTLSALNPDRYLHTTTFFSSDTATVKAVEEFLCGGLAGVFSKVGVFPLDVIRKRLQIAGHGLSGNLGVTTRLTTWNMLLQIVRNEGFTALYKGLAPGLIKAAPASAVTFAVYEQTKRLLEWVDLDE